MTLKELELTPPEYVRGATGYFNYTSHYIGKVIKPHLVEVININMVKVQYKVFSLGCGTYSTHVIPMIRKNGVWIFPSKRIKGVSKEYYDNELELLIKNGKVEKNG